MRLSTPSSRRKVMFMASALNVVDMTLMPRMPGTMTFSVFWSPEKIAPKRKRKISGRMKEKKAAVGLRQNIPRSRRHCRYASAAPSAMMGLLGGLLGGQLEIDVLQRGPR